MEEHVEIYDRQFDLGFILLYFSWIVEYVANGNFKFFGGIFIQGRRGFNGNILYKILGTINTSEKKCLRVGGWNRHGH